jgi:SAM-dependent methyltransferase
MNANHRQLCESDEWGMYIRDELLPWVLGDRPLGDDVLEIGPGPGLTTELLRPQTARLTTVEADEQAAAALAGRMAGTGVSVVHANATRLPFEAARFTSVVALTMLHHVSSREAQDRLLAEVYRVTRPGGRFVGEDSTDDPGFREFHEGDVCVPVDPDTFEDRLLAAGFSQAEVELGDGVFRFAAVRRRT